MAEDHIRIACGPPRPEFLVPHGAQKAGSLGGEGYRVDTQFEVSRPPDLVKRDERRVKIRHLLAGDEQRTFR
jgi:hypothetical protein